MTPLRPPLVDGSWIRRQRRLLDITQEDLALRVGCTASMLKKVERGERTLSPALATRITDTLVAVSQSGSQPGRPPGTPTSGLSGVGYGATPSPVPAIACRLVLGYPRAARGLHGFHLTGDAVLGGGSETTALTAFSGVPLLLRALTYLGGSVPCAVHASVNDGPLESSLERMQFLLSLGSPGTITTDDLAAALIRQYSTDYEIVGLGQFHRSDGTSESVHRIVTRSAAEPRPLRSALPFLSSTTIGRDDIVNELHAAGRSSARRFLVLCGPGGVGKTRVAIEVARRLSDGFRVVFLDALGARSTDTFRTYLASALGLKDGAAPEAISAALVEAETVLVVDNAEQVPDIVSFLSTINTDSSLRILLTSRVPLGRGTRECTIAPLRVPAPGTPSGIAATYPAVQLFVERAKSARHEFAPSADDIHAISEICRRLDGLPLAIELVAARLRFTADVDSVLKSFEDHSDAVDLASVGERRVDNRVDPFYDLRPDRHRTLDATVEWTLSLLPDSLRALTETLGIFPSSFAEAAVVDVALITETNCAQLLDELVLRGLAVHEPINPGGQRKWRLLRTVRAVVRRHAASSEDGTGIQKRFQLHVATRAHAHAKELYGANQSAACLALDDDLVDIRMVLQVLASRDEPEHNEAAADLAGRMLRYWIWAGLAEECAALYEKLSTRPISVPVRARLANTAGTAALFQSKFAQATPLLDTALNLWLAANDSLGIADALANLGVLAGMQGDLERAAELTQKSMDRRELVGDRRGLAISHGNLGYAAFSAGNLHEAQVHLSQSVALHRELEDGLLLCEALIDLAIVEEHAENFDSARTLILQSAELGAVSMLGSLASVAEVGASIAVHAHPASVENAMNVAELLGMSEYLRQMEGVGSPQRPSFQVASHAAQKLLGALRFHRATEAGRKAFDGIVVLRRSILAKQVSDKIRTTLTPALSVASILTEREIQLLRLGAEGLTTEEIGQKLFLSSSTVRSHLQSTYRKLDAPNRAAAVRRAIECGLI